MYRYSFILALSFLLPMGQVCGQVLKSQKSFIKAEAAAPETIKDTLPPSIKMITPQADFGTTYTTSETELMILGKVSDASGVNTLIIDGRMVEINENGIFSKKLDLLPGINEIMMIPMDNKDNFRKYQLVIEVTPEQISLADKISEESEYFALIIGINNYYDPAIRSLEHAVQDAETLYSVLAEKYTFKEDHINLLKDARRDEIIYTLDNLSREVSPEDNLLIFYAGHGMFDKEANIGYWLPSDARKISKTDWFRNSTLVDYLKEIKSKHTLLITDACFGGSIFNTRSAFLDASKAIEKLYELPSRKAMTSGMLSEVPDKSSFTRFLIERLRENEDKYLSSEQLFSSLRIAVINNSDAVPQYGEIRNVGDQGGDFIFIMK
jgi:hypothetical protein